MNDRFVASVLVTVAISAVGCVGPALAQGRNIPEALRAKCAQQAQQQAQAAQIRGYGAGRARMPSVAVRAPGGARRRSGKCAGDHSASRDTPPPGAASRGRV